MCKIISVTKNEIVLSLPKGEVMRNKEIIFTLASRVSLEINEDDVLRAQKFSDKYQMSELIIIVNSDGVSFLPDIYFKK